ncbi:trypsin-like peptidase domain-containing protein [Aliifodinibius sp. S!AR15-10]|uniref:trypsin-like peptidase domain-containing protein n=1 Tax=Aliifodinibius sp. S!AR15-10 TaxID=2950437 RepID=UPI002856EC4C|nr:trypsin-like peptidase domain-containing protein [Aliifodinibius sp. S!AR15-10]MDR8391162.1 trypsin-like peptidase domain-containing protein [Aliifodinibius sp. S!AR15-10]
MKSRNRYLTGVLLLLIGIVIGTIFSLYQQGVWVNDQAQVNVTEVKRSSEPVLPERALENVDARFLFKSVAQRVKPTVVYIETVIPVNGAQVPDDENHDRDEGFWDRFLPHKARTVGSGVIITEDGYILTNNHVIDDAVQNGIEVVLNDKRMFKARVVGTDPSTDLAVIKIDSNELPSIVVGNSNQVEVGEWVLAIGNPFRLRSTVTAGIVSAMGRGNLDVIHEQLGVESFIQTDAAINKGNSGGALVNTSGELIGINTAIASQSGNYQGYGFAVPANLALKVARDIIEYGEVRRALLGVSIQGVDQRLADELSMDKIRGVMISDVESGLAADEFGLQSRDVILAVNDEPVNEANELQEKIAVLSPGDVAKLTIWRGGDEFDRNVKLGQIEEMSQEVFSNSLEIRPEEEQEHRKYGNGVEFGTFSLGFKVMALSKPENAEKFDLIITEIEESSEAKRRGLKEGYEILKVNKTKVEDLETLKDLIDRSLGKQGSVLLQVETEDGAVGHFELKQ